MDYTELKEIVRNGIALRYSEKHQPAGGPGSKVLPSLFAENRYAFEDRLIEGTTRHCVLLDTVASQANRMETVISSARGEMAHGLPGVAVVFPPDDPELAHIGTITDMDAPHRISDAIIRDSEYKGVRFGDTEFGTTLRTASLSNATEMFGLSPVSLIFGFWDSMSPIKGRNHRFERTIAGEIVGVDVVEGVGTRSRLDPLNLTSMKVYSHHESLRDWSLDRADENGKKYQYSGKITKVLHSSLRPDVMPDGGGVTIDYAHHSILLSLPTLRRLRFPGSDGTESDARNTAARTVLAALALIGASRMLSAGLHLRSRTILVPEQVETWDLIALPGPTRTITISPPDVAKILDEAVAEALEHGLPWRKHPITLTPSNGLLLATRKAMRVNVTEDQEVE